MADNQDLINALAAYPQARQPGEDWLMFLRRQAPEALGTMMNALSAVGFRGPRGGIAPQDYAIASRIQRQNAGNVQALGGGEFAPLDPGVAGGPIRPDMSFLDRIYSTQELRRAAAPPKEAPLDPYDAAMAWQKFMRGAANSR